MKIIFTAVVMMLVCGMALGSGWMNLKRATSLDEELDRTNRAIKVAEDWKRIAETWKGLALRNETTARECVDMLRQQRGAAPEERRL